MRRGLIAWSKAELPPAVFEQRLARAQRALAATDLDALILYTNNSRTAGVSWFVGFIPYWSEGLLVIPRSGNAKLVVGLSKRVQFWLDRTCHVAVHNAPRIGIEASRIIAGMKPGAAIGVADLDGLPAGTAEDISLAGEGLRLIDATALAEQLRGPAEPAEIALSFRAAEIARLSLAAANAGTGIMGAILAAVEREARCLGAEEIYLAAAPDLASSRHLRRIEGEASVGHAFALRATVAYKGHWIRLTRTFGIEDALIATAEERFAAAVALLPDTRGFADAGSWLIEGCRISQPLEALAGNRIGHPVPLEPGSLISVQASYRIDGNAMLMGAPVLTGRDGAAATMLARADFVHV